MGRGDEAAVNEEEGESLSDCPSSSHTVKASDSPALVQDDECTALPPCGVDDNVDDSSSSVWVPNQTTSGD